MEVDYEFTKGHISRRIDTAHQDSMNDRSNRLI